MTAPGDREPAAANDGAPASLGLDAAIAATRRGFDGESRLVAATERRLLESVRHRRRLRPGTWLVPLAAAFVASAAVAHGFGAFGTLRTRWFGATLASPSAGSSASGASSARTAVPATSATPVVSPTPSATSLPAPTPAAPAAPATPAPASPTPPQPPDAVRAETPSAPAPAAVAPEPPSAEPAKLDEMALYREAHRAHFAEQNYALALSRWDRYLSLVPRGAFVLEARYNRGVALYRLGRREAAMEALRPFAEGAYGGYRSEEAARILEQLR